MAGFKQLEGEFAVTVSGGVYKQSDVYERNGLLFVKHGSGFVQLDYMGGTSTDKLRLDELNVETPLAMTKLGRICIKGHPAIPEQKPLPEERSFLMRAELPKLD